MPKLNSLDKLTLTEELEELEELWQMAIQKGRDTHTLIERIEDKEQDKRDEANNEVRYKDIKKELQLKEVDIRYETEADREKAAKAKKFKNEILINDMVKPEEPSANSDYESPNYGYNGEPSLADSY